MTAYVLRISYWSSCVFSSDLIAVAFACRTQDWSADQIEEAHEYVGFYEPLDRGYLETLAGLLANADEEHKPDLILMEIQSWIPDDMQFPDYQVFLDTGRTEDQRKGKGGRETGRSRGEP